MVQRPTDPIGRCIVCVPAILVWGLAGASAARWLMVMGKGRMTFGSQAAAGFLPYLWGLVVAGACAAAVLACLTCLGFGRKRWQVWSLLGAVIALCLVLGD